MVIRQFAQYASTVNTFSKEGYVFGRVGLFVCLFVRQQDYLKSNERICVKLLPKVCLGPLIFHNFVDDPHYDSDR